MYNAIDDSMTDCNVGSRKRRNIKDNLFVINAVSNEARLKTNEACDICVYDVKKCHHTLWLHECINDLWEAGIQDDKLVLLFLENKSAQIAIKTASGTCERISIHNKIMHGTVWAGLMCTNTMDGLGKEVYADPTLVYKYRDTVHVPPLEMVDDIISASKCGPTTVALNAAVNSFVERKKLKLSTDKCARINIGNKTVGHIYAQCIFCQMVVNASFHMTMLLWKQYVLSYSPCHNNQHAEGVGIGVGGGGAMNVQHLKCTVIT